MTRKKHWSIMTDKNITVQVLRDRVKNFAKDRNFEQYHSLKNLAMALSCETAEFMDLLLWQSDAEINARLTADRVFKQKLFEELGDVMHVVLAVANNIDGCDLSTVFFEKMKKTEERYTIAKSYGSNEKC